MSEAGTTDVSARENEIDRKDTGVRILLTILFVLIASAIETVLGLIVLFELVWSLLTRQPPGERVRALANRIVAYYYRIGRYLTYNESRVPFPFSDFPEALEASRWRPDERETESIGLPRGERSDPEPR